MEQDSVSLRDDYRSMRDLATATLRQRILDHTLKPNERLRQEDLAARLGISRMPIREALRQLEAEGLVVLTAHGATVAAISPEGMWEEYLMRSVLEGLAARLGTENLQPETLAGLAASHEEMRHFGESGDRTAVLEQVRLIHETLYECSGMPNLCRAIRTLRTNCERYRRAYISVAGRVVREVEINAELLEACRARDAERAERIVRASIVESATTLRRYLGADGKGTGS